MAGKSRPQELTVAGCLITTLPVLFIHLTNNPEFPAQGLLLPTFKVTPPSSIEVVKIIADIHGHAQKPGLQVIPDSVKQAALTNH